MATTPGYPTNSTSSSQLPQWMQDYSMLGANILAGQMNAYNNIPLYNQPLTAGLTDQQVNLINQTQGASPEAPYLQASNYYLGGYNPRYNASALSQFMNPYTQSTVGVLEQLSNRNLINNILPSVNSTFTGAGQFGSTRNNIFTNRALYENQLATDQTAMQALNNQFNNAMNQYYQWNNNPLNAASTSANIGNTASNAYWNGINNQYALASKPQQTAQTGMTNSYQNWLTQLGLPGSLMNTNAQTYNNLVGKFSPYVSQGSYVAQTGVPTSSLVGGIGSGLINLVYG